MEGDAVQIQAVREIEIVPGVNLECVEKFCYLGDTLGVGGGVEEASRARVRSAWAKFRELAPILTARGASLLVKGKVYRACVQSVMILVMGRFGNFDFGSVSVFSWWKYSVFGSVRFFHGF